jgi:2-polyprenyl-6-methoxyphenol hydroxylase-like FAD-dependent oxidoreductase
MSPLLADFVAEVGDDDGGDERTELVERQQTWHALGAGFLVHANGMRMLLALGLAASVENAGTIVCRWQFCDEQGDLLSETDLDALWGDVGCCVGIERPKRQRALLPGVAQVRLVSSSPLSCGIGW